METTSETQEIVGQFPSAWREGVYQGIHLRRNIYSYRPDPVAPEMLARLLNAAHHAPSVGLMQPWTFLLVTNQQTRLRVQDLYEREHRAAAQFFDEPRKSQYLSFKLAGILDAPVNLCITCDPMRAGAAVLGRNSMPETDVYSTCCAVENLWLAARAEGLGVGWVSILKLPQLRAILNIPHHVIPVAYLCIGYPEDRFDTQPKLEKAKWRSRLPLASVIAYEQWGQAEHPDWSQLHELTIRLSSLQDDSMEPGTNGPKTEPLVP